MILTLYARDGEEWIVVKEDARFLRIERRDGYGKVFTDTVWKRKLTSRNEWSRMQYYTESQLRALNTATYKALRQAVWDDNRARIVLCALKHAGLLAEVVGE